MFRRCFRSGLDEPDGFILCKSLELQQWYPSENGMLFSCYRQNRTPERLNLLLQRPSDRNGADINQRAPARIDSHVGFARGDSFLCSDSTTPVDFVEKLRVDFLLRGCPCLLFGAR